MASNLSDAPSAPPVPIIAIYAMALAPYEAHLYRRMAAELPAQVRVLLAYGDTSRNWEFEGASGVEFEDLSGGDRQVSMFSLGAQLREWRRGGKVIERLAAINAQALILAGYNDLGRLRVLRWCRRRGIPVLLRADSNLADEHRNSALKRLIKRAYVGLVSRRVTSILAVGPLGVAYWKHYGVPAEKIHVASYEPDYALLEQLPEADVAAVAQQYGIDRARRRFVFSGRFARMKRVDLLLHAFSRVAGERPDWDLLLVGDGELRSELETITPPELKHRVLWTGFLSNQRDVSLLYKLCDVLVLSSEYEPWAVVVNEAAAGGLALVCSDVVGAASALLRPGINGVSFPRGDVDALTRALLEVSDPANTDRYRANSPEVLKEWRRDADPVEGVRQALRQAGVKLLDNPTRI